MTASLQFVFCAHVIITPNIQRAVTRPAKGLNAVSPTSPRQPETLTHAHFLRKLDAKAKDGTFGRRRRD